MYREIRDDDVLQRFWQDERENMPRWIGDGTDARCIDRDGFIEFCHRMWKIYLINDEGLLYIEKHGDIGEIHFSLLRNADAVKMIPDFIDIRNKTLGQVDMICGWTVRQNKGLQRILNACGFNYYGLQMFYGESHGKVLEWRCFSINRRQLYVAKDAKTLLHLAN